MPSSPWMKQYLNEKLADERYYTEEEVRNHFGIHTGMCVDGVVHSYDCSYFLVEEKSTSDIPKAIDQLEMTYKRFQAKGLNVVEAVIACTSLRRVQYRYTNRNGYLYDKRQKQMVRINKNVRVKVEIKPKK